MYRNTIFLNALAKINKNLEGITDYYPMNKINEEEDKAKNEVKGLFFLCIRQSLESCYIQDIPDPIPNIEGERSNNEALSRYSDADLREYARAIEESV